MFPEISPLILLLLLFSSHLSSPSLFSSSLLERERDERKKERKKGEATRRDDGGKRREALALAAAEPQKRKTEQRRREREKESTRARARAMNTFMNMFSGNGSGSGGSGSGGGSGGSGSGLLNDWNSYSEAHGSGGGGGGDPFSSSDVENRGSSFMEKSLGDAGSYVNSLVSKGTSSLTQSVTSTTAFMPSGKQWAYFAGFMAAGGLFLSLAIFLFLPMLVIAPAKFATSFTLGCVCIMASFFALRGWKQQLVHMSAKERLPFTGAYVGSIFGTLYASLWMKSYLLSIFFSGVQMFALLYYVSSYFPGGPTGMKMMVSSISSGAMQMIKAIFRS